MVFDWDGNTVYAAADTSKGGMSNSDCPFLVKVSITNLNIRKGAGTDTAKTGQNTGILGDHQAGEERERYDSRMGKVEERG